MKKHLVDRSLGESSGLVAQGDTTAVEEVERAAGDLGVTKAKSNPDSEIHPDDQERVQVDRTSLESILAAGSWTSKAEKKRSKFS